MLVLAMKFSRVCTASGRHQGRLHRRARRQMPPPEGSGVGMSSPGANAPRKRNRDKRETYVEADPVWVAKPLRSDAARPCGPAGRPVINWESSSDETSMKRPRIEQ
jgi:hypothetical protein